METCSALLALCEGNSPVTSEFPSQRPVTQRFDAFFDLHLYKRLSKQSIRWWFEMQLRPLWCHCDVIFDRWNLLSWPVMHGSLEGEIIRFIPTETSLQSIRIVTPWWSSMELLNCHLIIWSSHSQLIWRPIANRSTENLYSKQFAMTKMTGYQHSISSYGHQVTRSRTDVDNR